MERWDFGPREGENQEERGFEFEREGENQEERGHPSSLGFQLRGKVQGGERVNRGMAKN